MNQKSYSSLVEPAQAMNNQHRYWGNLNIYDNQPFFIILRELCSIWSVNLYWVRLITFLIPLKFVIFDVIGLYHKLWPIDAVER